MAGKGVASNGRFGLAIISRPAPRRARPSRLALTALLALSGLASAQVGVPSDWSLIPSGLGPGDKFRLIFVTSTRRAGTSGNIDNYNNFVRTAVGSGHDDIQDYSTQFTVLASTASTDARDNTRTTFTSSDKGVPIYWLSGNKVADNYEDFYDGSWDDETNAKDESGADCTVPSPSSGHSRSGGR